MESSDFSVENRINYWTIVGVIFITPALIFWIGMILFLSGLETLNDIISNLHYGVLSYQLWIFAIDGCPILALITSVIAIKQIKQRKQKGLALARLTVKVSGLHLLFAIPALLSNIFYPS